MTPPQPPPDQPTRAWPPNGGPVYPLPGYPTPKPPPSRWTPLRMLLLAVAVIVALCGVVSVTALVGSGKQAGTAGPAASPSADDVPPAEAFDMKPGATLTVTADGGVQEVTVRDFRIRASCGGGTDPKNGSYLVVDVLVKQVEGMGSVNPMYFTFAGSDGTTQVSGSGMFSGCAKNELGATNSLRSGQRRVGQIVYDVANADGAVELSPGLTGDVAGSWRIG